MVIGLHFNFYICLSMCLFSRVILHQNIYIAVWNAENYIYDVILQATAVYGTSGHGTPFELRAAAWGWLYVLVPVLPSTWWLSRSLFCPKRLVNIVATFACVVENFSICGFVKRVSTATQVSLLYSYCPNQPWFLVPGHRFSTALGMILIYYSINQSNRPPDRSKLTSSQIFYTHQYYISHNATVTHRAVGRFISLL